MKQLYLVILTYAKIIIELNASTLSIGVNYFSDLMQMSLGLFSLSPF